MIFTEKLHKAGYFFREHLKHDKLFLWPFKAHRFGSDEFRILNFEY